MKIKTLTIISFLTSITALIWYGAYNECIIIRSPFAPNLLRPSMISTTMKKDVTLALWRDEQWNYEKKSLLWGPYQGKNITLLLQSWLLHAREENVINHPVILQAAFLTTAHELFISFDQPPYNPALSIYQKWHIIESILKTIQINEPCIRSVRFLCNNTQLHDSHLDFTNPWPIDGFMTSLAHT